MDRKLHTSIRAATPKARLRNTEIAQRLNDIATMFELHGGNPSRIRAYRDAARLVAGYGRDISDMIVKGKVLETLPGIGSDTANKIRDLALTGTTPLLQSLERKTPRIALELSRIRGLGAKRVRTLLAELGIQTFEQLHSAVLEGRIRMIPGFGAKLERLLLDALKDFV